MPEKALPKSLLRKLKKLTSAASADYGDNIVLVFGLDWWTFLKPAVALLNLSPRSGSAEIQSLGLNAGVARFLLSD